MADAWMNVGELFDALDTFAVMADPATLVVVEHRGYPTIRPVPVRRADLRTDEIGQTRIVLTVDG
jgi:hypothetical protein